MKKWLKEIKQRRKEDGRLRRAEVHAAISVASVAAALAAIAAENSKKDEPSTAKEAAVASAAALVAAQCAKVAEAMGAKREQLSSLIGSAMSGTNASDILTLTAAAATCKTIYPPPVVFIFFYKRIIWVLPRLDYQDTVQSTLFPFRLDKVQTLDQIIHEAPRSNDLSIEPTPCFKKKKLKNEC
jgi:hypothetical protein